MNSDRMKRLFAQANEFKEGDLAVGGTSDEAIRKDAKRELALMKIGDIARHVFIEDEITEAIHRSIDRQLLREISHLKVSDMKEALLGTGAASWAGRYSDGLPSEVIASAVKIMSNEELSRVSNSIFITISGANPQDGAEIGSSGHFGSRIQPNSPGDDEEEILFSVLEGLAFGCGDVIIGLNPASDDVETIARTEKLLERIVLNLNLPTRYCVLSDMVKQTSAGNMTRLDVGFQSLAGTSKSLTGMLGLDVKGLLDLAKGFDGLYFETGQGSEVTNSAARGVDMVTLESRCYGLARYLRNGSGNKWMIVNDVAGFIGPEVFRTGGQLLRACLEDMVMAKLHGITMGLDVCSTFHMGIDPFELKALTEKIVQAAAPAYLMGVAGKADPMLGILTTSFREHPRLRRLTGKRISGPMAGRLAGLGVLDADGTARGAPQKTSMLYAAYIKAVGDSRSLEELKTSGLRKIASLRERGMDIGYGSEENLDDPPPVTERLGSIYAHARNALYAAIDASVIRDCCPGSAEVSTISSDREDYLLHPPSGERIGGEGEKILKRLYSADKKTPQIMMVISDGLNANAVNENLRDVLPALRWHLRSSGFHVGEIDVVIKNGRVRAGYHAAELAGPEAVIHFIGERPGTGLNQLSVYVTYGRDASCNNIFSPDMDHSLTTAICSINKKGKRSEAAVEDIMRCAIRMFELKCSGVRLGKVDRSS